MTIIAYRNGVLAADRQLYNDGVSTWGTMIKIARSPTGIIGGSCGQPALIFKFTEWLRTGAIKPFDAEGERDWEGFAVGVDRVITAYDRLGGHPVQGPYLAVGSGKEVAFGAFFAGASAELAVCAAIAHHAQCGGEVDVLRSD